MRNFKSLLILFILSGMMLSSCRIFNPSVMLRTKRNHVYAMPTDSVPSEYIIQPGDLLSFRLFSNEGFRIVDIGMLEGGNANQQASQQAQNLIAYRVEADSVVNMPIVGRTALAGMDLKQAEIFLEEKYRNYYNDPYVVITANNRRIIIFPGEGGAAQVVPIQNEYTTVIEALAMAGGISRGGKAHRIKIIRGGLNNPEYYFLDLSTVKGLNEAKHYYLKANDIVYVEPSYFVGSQVIGTASQILGIVSSSILTYFLILQLN